MGAEFDLDSELDDTTRPHLLTSVVHDLERLYLDRMRLYAEGGWSPGPDEVGLAEGAFWLGGGRMEPDVRQRAEGLMAQVVDGSLVLPVVPDQAVTILDDVFIGYDAVTTAADLDGAASADGSAHRLPLGSRQGVPAYERLDFLEPYQCVERPCQLDAMFFGEDGAKAGTWIAGRPFHIRHGFANRSGAPLPAAFDVVVLATRREGPDLPDDMFPLHETFAFHSDYTISEDSSRCGPDHDTQTGVEPCEVFVHDFADGLPPGRWDLTAVWLAPCSAWAELGLSGDCSNRNQVVSRFESRVNMPFYGEEPAPFLPWHDDNGHQWPHDPFDLG